MTWVGCFRAGPASTIIAVSKKVTGTTLGFCPVTLATLERFSRQRTVKRVSRSKQQVIGTMFGFLPNDLGRLFSCWTGQHHHRRQ
jgi:hypothetical protein